MKDTWSSICERHRKPNGQIKKGTLSLRSDQSNIKAHLEDKDALLAFVAEASGLLQSDNLQERSGCLKHQRRKKTRTEGGRCVIQVASSLQGA